MNAEPAEPLLWCRGEILPETGLAIPVTDRVFEHGLGLFETMRGQVGRVPLWDIHRRRLTHSAHTLGLKLDEPNLPCQADFAALLEANGLERSASRLRLVLTGGTSAAAGIVYVSARPLSPVKTEGLTLADTFWPVDLRDPLIRHKSLNYWARRIAHEQAVAAGADDALSQAPDGTIWESAHASLFLVTGGRFFAPPAAGPMLASIAAGEVGRLLSGPGLPGIERVPVTEETLARADELILANAARGPMSVSAWRDRRYDPSGPGFRALRDLWRKAWF